MASRTSLLVLLLLATSTNVFGLLGFGRASWKEEVLLHDERKLIIERSQTRGGQREVGQPPPVKTHVISFKMPGSNKTITWESEYGEDIGRANFDLLALHILNGIPYVVATPNLCLSYNKWGRPNPPYVFFKYDGTAWHRIPLSDVPIEFKAINVTVSTLGDEDKLLRLGLVSAERIKELNSYVRQPEYKTILRAPIPQGGQGLCPDLVFYKGAWIGPGDSIGKRMMDSKSK